MSANNSFGSMPYLNQTGHYIIKGNSSFANVINGPYKMLRSFSGAVSLQYQQAHDATEFSTGLRQFLNILGFFFSGYAVACFATAMLLNGIAILPNSRTRENPLRLSAWTRIYLHVTAIIPMMVAIFLLNRNWGNQSMDIFLLKMYYVIIWSYIVETVTSVAAGQIPLESSDYTIFELSIQFYNMKKLSNADLISHEYLSDCTVAMLSRLLIHIVEIFSAREKRLIGSTILNIGYLSYLGKVTYERGPFAISSSTKFRQIPKLFGILVVGVSAICYFLACLVRINPLYLNRTHLEDLKFHSFMQNWTTHVNFKGDEDFLLVISRLAMLLCSGTNSSDKAMHREFSNVNIPNRINTDYAISDTLFQVKEHRFDNDSDPLPDSNKYRSEKDGNWFKYILLHVLIQNPWNIIHRLIFRNPTGVPVDDVALGNVMKSETDSDVEDTVEFASDSELDETGETIEEDHIEDNAYTWMLLENDLDDNENSSSEDSEYIPEDMFVEDELTNLENKGESLIDKEIIIEDKPKLVSEQYANNTGNISLDNQIDIIELRSQEKDMGWFLSLQSIFNFHLTHAERITRSKFSEMKAQDAKNNMDAVNSDTDLLCAVCKTNERDIILWPCNCFAMCDACRISLSLRGYDTCVCCRRAVDGYSKIVDTSK
ncbi:hypothetical protein C6P45_001791 [Maudiozyma exigua]|uniref:RING-type domain-containing protein n=1 Tax=Maudiozyma exigua TaxID=34358 RepID=A0A9P6WE10_MAUEX|nr:hypothetical protein C6P45_001791 [Kazachstania exigua]